MTERVQFMATYLSQMYSMTEFCERFGIRRNTGDTCVRRYGSEGPVGLQEKSRAPHRCPRRLSAEVKAKRAHPTWGPRQILPHLTRRRPALALPAPSTAGELFRAAGLSQARPRRRRHRHPSAIPFQAEGPKAVWPADFKGQFRTGDGLYCYLLTVADAYSRFPLSCAARLSTTQVEARPIVERLFHAYGLPEAIRPVGHPGLLRPGQALGQVD